MINLIIDDIDLTDVIIIIDINRGLSPEREYKETVFSAIDGGKLHNARWKPRRLNISYAVIGEIDQKVKLLQSVLLSDNKHKIVFSDKSDRYFEARFNGQITFNKITSYYAVGTFELLCEMPFAYSTTLYQKQSKQQKISFSNTGDFKCYPLYEFTSSSNISFISFVHPKNGQIMVGNDRGDVIIPAGAKVSLDSQNGVVMLGNNKRLWLSANSKRFGIDKGITDVGIVVNSGATVPIVTAKYREVYAC